VFCNALDIAVKADGRLAENEINELAQVVMRMAGLERAPAGQFERSAARTSTAT
jgi:hypothetical protein